jgi:glucosamine--fructose-6-phosphate aminotransferase (isomerizing)
MNMALRTASTVDDAFSNTLTKLVGSFAIAVIVDGYEDVMLVARNGSPLAIGYGDPDASGTSEMFVGSDALALAPFTENVSIPRGWRLGGYNARARYRARSSGF